MDPISAISLSASVIGTIDVVVRTISALRSLQERWKAVDLIISSLLGQLSTLKTALLQISDWVSHNLKGEIQYHQLVMDLEASIKSCQLLVSDMDSFLADLEWDEKNVLNFSSKARALLNDDRVKECSAQLGHQSMALNLLLTPLNCQSLSEQKQLLEASQSRRTLDQVKDDSSSLIVLRHSTSFNSSWTTSTERSSVLNRVFDFDGEVIESKVYRNHMRYLIRRVFRKRHVRDLWSQDWDAANPFIITIYQGPRLVALDPPRYPHLMARLVSEKPKSFVTRDFVIYYNCETHSLLEHGLRTQYPIYPTADTTEVKEYVRLSWERT